MKNEINADDFNKKILNLLENPKLLISQISILASVMLMTAWMLL